MHLLYSSRHLLGLALVAAVGLTVGCSDDDDPVTPTPTTGAVMIEVGHIVGSADLELGTIQYTNAFGNEYSVNNLEYILSDFFVMNDDGRHEIDGVYYVSADDEGTHTIMVEGFPPGHYHVLGFTWGLDEEDNVPHAYSDDPNFFNMEWPEPMGDGYHYMKIEGRYLTNEQTEAGYATHAGQFRGGDRNEPHFVEEALTLHQNIVAGETLVLTLNMDINKWYESPNVIDLSTHGNGIMGSNARQVELEQNCVDVFTLLGGGSHGRP